MNSAWLSRKPAHPCKIELQMEGNCQCTRQCNCQPESTGQHVALHVEALGGFVMHASIGLGQPHIAASKLMLVLTALS